MSLISKTRIPPPADLVEDEDTIILSNKKPIQVYSERVLKKFMVDKKGTVRIAAIGAAITTAHRVAKFCKERLRTELNWGIETMVEKEGTVVVEERAEGQLGSGFGVVQPPLIQRRVDSIVLALVRV